MLCQKFKKANEEHFFNISWLSPLRTPNQHNPQSVKNSLVWVLNFLLLSLKFNGTRFCDFHKIFSGEWLEVTMDKYYSFKNFRTSNLNPKHICQKNLVFDSRVQISNQTERVLSPAHVRVVQSSFFGISRTMSWNKILIDIISFLLH